jgi:hypothetical protein
LQLILCQVDRLCEVLKANNAAGKSSDLFLGLRCFTMDTITSFCFAKTVDALGETDFKAPIIKAMEDTLPTFVVFKHFSLIRQAVFAMPARLSALMSPRTAGLTQQLENLVGAQVKEVTKNPESLQDAPHRIIYHELLSPEANKENPSPDATSLYEEAQALIFGGTNTNGNVLMLGAFHLLEIPKLVIKLKAELLEVWPALENAPRFEELEKLPFLVSPLQFPPSVMPLTGK